MTDETTARDRAIATARAAIQEADGAVCEHHVYRVFAVAAVDALLAHPEVLRALASAPTADKATREVVEIWRSVSMVDVEVRRRWPGLAAGLDRLAAAPEGVDAADELLAGTRAARDSWRDEALAHRAAIQRVRELAERLEYTPYAGRIRRALDGDTTEEER